MKTLLLLAAATLLSACQSLPSTDPASISFDIPKGSSLSLNKALQVDNKETHVSLQYGKISTEKARDLYQVSCRLEMKAFGPRTVKPQTFQITRVENNIEPEVTSFTHRYYTEVFLHSDDNADILRLDCEVWGDPMDGSFPVADMQKALGDYFTFNFARSAP